MKQCSILVIEDDVMLADFICELLCSAAYQMTNATSAEKGLAYFQQHHYDLVLLDISLPDADGLQLLNDLLAIKSVPIIVISSRQDCESRISALAQGADDYLSKPFHPKELQLRIEKRLRHCSHIPVDCPAKEAEFLQQQHSLPKQSTQQHSDQIHSMQNRALQDKPQRTGLLSVANTPLILDLKRRLCRLNQQPLELTPSEFAIMETLAQAKGHVVSHNTLFDILSELLGSDSGRDSVVGSLPVLVHRLRKKLKAVYAEQELILTVPRQGYRLNQLG